MNFRLAAGLALTLAATLAHAQSWPVKPVKMIVPFPAGGPTDVLTRALSDKLSTALGQPVVVDNKPGAGGAIGTDLAAKSPADGYTLLMATGSTHSVGPYLQKLPYDPVKDFTPIVYVGYATNIMLVSPKVPAKNVREFIELAKANPGKYNYSTSGIGSVAHLTAEMFAAQAGIKLTHVPYKGTQLSIPDLVQGDVAILFDKRDDVQAAPRHASPEFARHLLAQALRRGPPTFRPSPSRACRASTAATTSASGRPRARRRSWSIASTAR
jgi:tripartite-type tricarboxylate transporter receptor subunit TctC